MPAANSAVSDAALTAALLSFGKKPPTHPTLPLPKPLHRSRPASPLTSPERDPLRAARRSSTPYPGTLGHLRSSSSMAAASIAFARHTGTPHKHAEEEGEGERIIPVRLRRKLFQEGENNGDPSRQPPPVRPMTPERRLTNSPDKQEKEERKVDSTSLDDISLIKSKFETGAVSKKSPPIQAPKANNPSLTAVVLATISPPSSSSPESSRKASPNRRGPSSPTCSSPENKKAQSEGPPAPPPPRNKSVIERKPTTLQPELSKESLISSEATTETRSSSLAAATITHNSSKSSPENTGPQSKETAPQPPPPRRTKTVIIDPPALPARSDTKPLPPPVPPHRSHAPRASTSSLPARPPALPPRDISLAKTAAVVTAGFSGNSSFAALSTSRKGGDDASTIAASLVLVSSHTESPGPRRPPKTKEVPTPPPPRRRRSLPSLSQRPTTLPQTLRPPSKESPPPAIKPSYSGGALRKSAHHERQRWSWHITAKERARYEGLWAANRGLLLPREKEEFVVNVVVRDIWRRSRLPFGTLSEIWDLVDRGRKGCLSREEFSVGTWLVDIALSGGKPPARVQESVWEDVRTLGVVMPPPVRRATGR